MQFINAHWDQITDVLQLSLTCVSILAAAGLLVRRNRTMKELLYVEQERDDVRKRLARSEVRLDKVDPRRFEEAAESAYNSGDFDKAEKLALAFTNEQSEAIGLAAEILAEQRLLDSENGRLDLAEDATRFAQIGLAATPDSKRLQEIAVVARQRQQDIKNGDPIEALNMHKMSATQLNHASHRLHEAGAYILAEVASRRSVLKCSVEFGEKSPQHAISLATHAKMLGVIGDTTNAEEVSAKSQEIAEEQLDKSSYEYAAVLNIRAGVLEDLGEKGQAEELYREAIRICECLPGHEQFPENYSGLARILSVKGENEAAEQILRKAVHVANEVYGNSHPRYAFALGNLSSALTDLGKFDEAKSLAETSLFITGNHLGDQHPEYGNILYNLASLLEVQGDAEQADVLFGRAREIDIQTFGATHPEIALRTSARARVLFKAKRFEKSETLLREAIEIDEASLGVEHPDYAVKLNNLAELLRETGRQEEAGELFKRALALIEKALGADNSYTQIVRNNLEMLLADRAD